MTASTSLRRNDLAWIASHWLGVGNFGKADKPEQYATDLHPAQEPFEPEWLHLSLPEPSPLFESGTLHRLGLHLNLALGLGNTSEDRARFKLCRIALQIAD